MKKYWYCSRLMIKISLVVHWRGVGAAASTTRTKILGTGAHPRCEWIIIRNLSFSEKRLHWVWWCVHKCWHSCVNIVNHFIAINIPQLPFGPYIHRSTYRLFVCCLSEWRHSECFFFASHRQGLSLISVIEIHGVILSQWRVAVWSVWERKKTYPCDTLGVNVYFLFKLIQIAWRCTLTLKVYSTCDLHHCAQEG